MKWKTALVAALAATATAIISPTQAIAKSGMGGQGKVRSIQAAMVVRDIDERQAVKAGNRVQRDGGFKVLIDGKSGLEIARVPEKSSGQTVGPQMQPNDTVVGNCGSSNIDMWDNGSYDNVFDFSTGFNLNGSAYDFNWRVGFDSSDGGYFTWSDDGPQVPDANWTSGVVTEYTASDGWLNGSVLAESRAYLTDGRVCWTGGPRDTAYVT